MTANWEIKTLDELVESTLIGLVKNKSEQGDNKAFMYIKMHNITADNKLDISKIVRVDALAEEVEKYKLSEGDFLFNTRNSHELVGKSCIFSMHQMQPILFNNNIMRIRFTPEVDSKFIAYSFSSQYISEQLESIKNGTTNVSAIYYSSLKNVAITYPPLSEQKRIVAILDEAFEGIDRAIANTEKNLANSRELFESYLNAIFTQKGDGWVEKKLGNLLGTLTDYHANGSYEILKRNVSLLDNDGYAYMVRSTDFENNFTNNLKYIDKHAYEFLSKSKVFGGEIIISKIGNAGKVYLMPSIDRPCSLAMNLFLLRTDVDQIRSDYLYFFLESRFGKVQISERLNGTTTKTIRKDGIRSLNILVPPLPEQKNIVNKLDSIVFETQRLETIYHQKLAALNELKQSILQKAFTGELTADTANQTIKAAQEANAA
ncbi:MAG: restriction endonuclease subunit S [Scytonema hyalinum WJT4-NPBG1]|jgi:type I restriction enzyme S subunit|nr:restriction endonuclease subunit S [Scytonema hyalinum WJT4-NPBG1]